MLGHSWGTMVAVSLALQAPTLVRSLVLLSGYYFPTARMDVVLSSPNAIPGIGDALRHTISPPLSAHAAGQHPRHVRTLCRALRPALSQGVDAAPSPASGLGRGCGADDPSVMELQQHYRDLKLPVVILTGGDDQIADVGRQSKRLHEEIPQSELTVLPGLGHMVHHLAPDAVIKAIDRAAELANVLSRPARPGSSPCSSGQARGRMGPLACLGPEIARMTLLVLPAGFARPRAALCPICPGASGRSPGSSAPKK